MDISLIWAGIIALGVFLYVILDGFDLGVGILFTFFHENEDRDLMIESVAPIWDGNETWLVLGGAALLAAFPVVYSAALPGLYMPLFLMLICLILRGASIELRSCSTCAKGRWNFFFMFGSIGAAFCQGVSLGAWITGFPIVNREYAGAAFDWLTPFSLFTGLGLILTYALLGCGYLIYKTEGEIQKKLFRLIKRINEVLMFSIVITCIWTPLHIPAIFLKWFLPANIIFFAPLPFLIFITYLGMRHAITIRHEKMPFILGLILVLIGYIGLLASLWPNLIPPALTIWDAAAPLASQQFSLIGVVIVLPFVVAYTSYAYWIFRGKVKAPTHYSH